MPKDEQQKAAWELAWWRGYEREPSLLDSYHFKNGYEAAKAEQEAIVREAKRAVLEELKDAMVSEMARINRGRGFKDTNEVHGVLPEQLRLLCAKYTDEPTKEPT